MLVLYKGARGKGKTLTMTKDAYQYHKDGYKVLSNYALPFSEEISNDEILELDKNSDIRECVLVIDEIQIFFDSRRSMKKENMKFSNFIQQIRKRKIILLCTTQYSNTIDLRLRQHLDVLAIPNFIEKYKVCTVEYVDLTSTENVDGRIISKTLVYDAREVFGLYETEEIIA